MTGVSELMGQSVWDCRGVWVGHVVDVRVIKHKGEMRHSVYGLLVSGLRGPVFMGLTRGREGRFGWLSEWLARVVYVGCTFVPWDAVDAYGEGEVFLKATRKELSRV